MGTTYLEELVSATPLQALGELDWESNGLARYIEAIRGIDSVQEADQEARALIALMAYLNDSNLDVPATVIDDGIDIIVRAAKSKNSSGWWFYTTWLELVYPRVPYSYATKLTGEFEKANLRRRVNWELLGDWAFLDGQKQDASAFWQRAARVSKWYICSAREKYAHLLLSESQSKKAFQEFKKISEPHSLVAASAEFEKLGDVKKSIALAQLAVTVPQAGVGRQWMQDESFDLSSPLGEEIWFYRLLARNGYLELALLMVYSRVIFGGATTSEEYRELLAELHALRNDEFAFDFWANGAWWARYVQSPVASRLFDENHESWAQLRFVSTGENGKLPDPVSSTNTLKIIDDFFMEIQKGGPLPAPNT